jgi:hypothetical protein
MVTIQSSSLGNSSNHPTTTGLNNGRSVFRMVGVACLAGFMLDIVVRVFPLQLGDLGWRVGLMQQVSDRSIILLLGLAFLTVGSLDRRQLRKQLAMVCLGLGLAFMLGSVIAIKDSVSLQKQTNSNITNQSTQLQERIQQAKNSPANGNAKITPEQIEQALQQVTQKADALQKSSQTQILKTGLASVGNLFIVGIALIGIGRYSLRAKL